MASGRSIKGTTTFECLPEELVEKILLQQQDIRTEAMSRMVCRTFNRLTLSQNFVSDRQSDEKTVLLSGAKYCPVIVPAFGSNYLRGWDTAAKKWCNLPTLDFLPAAHKEGMVVSYMCPCDNGLLFLTYELDQEEEPSVMEHYVCNLFTRSYVVIDLPGAATRSYGYRVMMRAGLGERGGSGFTLFDASHVPVRKLESNNMAAGWVELEKPPVELQFSDPSTYCTAPAMVDGIIYMLRSREDRRDAGNPWAALFLTSYHVDTGVWEEVGIPFLLSWDRANKHGIPHYGAFPVNQVTGVPPHHKQNFKKLKLMNLGGNLWLVQTPIELNEEREGTQIPGSWGVHVSRFDPELQTLINVERFQIPASVVANSPRLLHSGSPAVCFIGDDGGTSADGMRIYYSVKKPRVDVRGDSFHLLTKKISTYNVAQSEWVNYPNPRIVSRAKSLSIHKYYFHGGTFRLTHASLGS